MHIVSILLGHQPGNIGRVLFQHVNECLGQALGILLAAVRIRKRHLCLPVLFAHAAEIFVDRVEEHLVNAVFILHECFFLSGCGCLSISLFYVLEWSEAWTMTIDLTCSFVSEITLLDSAVYLKAV